jgi:hypothetical protein
VAFGWDSITPKHWLTSTGAVLGGTVEMTSVKINTVAGFTGTGAYTNFTIDNGIITAAS